MISSTDRLGNQTTFAWNALGLQASLTDAQAQTTRYVYDDYVRLYQTIWPDHVDGSAPGNTSYGITQTQYDSLNRVLRTTDQLGDTVTHAYDSAGRLLSRDYRTRANSPAGVIADSDTFTYDAAGNMVAAACGRYNNTVMFAYDAAGRKTSESLAISGKTYNCSTQYDAAGRVSKLIYPDASEVTRTYTARGQLHTLQLGSTTIDTRSYDNGGRMTASVYNNGVSESRSYNNDSTLASIHFTGAAIGDLSYGWDANKNKTAETITGVMSNYGFTASYDQEDRLISWHRNDMALDQSWNLSAVGDWNSFTQNSATQTRTHGPAHELTAIGTTPIAHDPKGNITSKPSSLDPTKNSTLTWDFNNRLTSVDTNTNGTLEATFQYDALGRRVRKNNTVFVSTGRQTIAEYVAGAASSSPVEKHVYASYIDEPVVRVASGNLSYYHRNGQYSIIAITSSTGSILERYAYDPYGKITFASASGTTIPSSNYSIQTTYTGRQYDPETGDYYFRARYYSAPLGRFTSRDPIRPLFELNQYSYVNGRVLQKRDPLGLFEWPDFPLSKKKYYDWWKEQIAIHEFDLEFQTQLTQGCLGVACTFLGYNDFGNKEFQAALSQCYHKQADALLAAKNLNCCEPGKGKNVYGKQPSGHVVSVQFSSAYFPKPLKGQTIEEYKAMLKKLGAEPGKPLKYKFGPEPIALSSDEVWTIVMNAPNSSINFDFAIWIDPPGKWLGANNGEGTEVMQVLFKTPLEYQKTVNENRSSKWNLDTVLYCAVCEKDYNKK